MNQPKLSRRSFLEAATAVGLASLGGTFASTLVEQPPSAFADDEGETKIVKTLCKGCVGDCGVLAHVRNGRVVKLEGDPDQIYSKGRMCAKGLSGLQMLYNPNRIKYPMKRAGARGENKWERISWDEALTTIAETLMDAADKYGPECLIIGNGGGGHTYYSDWCQRFANVYGSSNVFEPGGLQCYEPRVIANWILWGGQPTDIVNEGWPEMCLAGKTDMKSMVLWGTNPACSSIGQVGQAVIEARDQGVKSVVIDPRFTPDASKADVWLPVRPQSDLALVLCWIKYIIDNELYDQEAVMQWSNLPYLVNLETKMCLRPEEIGQPAQDRAYVVWDRTTNAAQVMAYPYDDKLDPVLDEGPYEINGIQCKTGFQLLRERCDEWTLEKAAETCWLDAGKIEEAIRVYTDNTPGAICVGMAADHTALSVQMGMGVMILNSLMGNFCKSGTIMQQYGAGQFTATHPFTPYVGRLQHFATEEQYLKRFGVTEYKGALYNQWSHNYTLQEAMLTGEPYPIKVYIERSTNKMINMPNTVRFEEALGKLDLIVHSVMYPTSLSMYADILLPETEWLETYWCMAAANKVYVRQPVTHLWEGVCEPMLWSYLAKKMADLGHQRFIDSFDQSKCDLTEENVHPGFIMDSISGAGQIAWWNTPEEWLTNNFKSNGGDVTWEELVAHVQENGYYEWCTDEEFLQFGQYKDIDPETGLPFGFSTPSGKLELYGEQMIPFGRTGAPYACYELPPASVDYDPLPYFREPEEGPSNPEFDEYPLLLTGGHIAMYTHGTLRNVPWIRERHPLPEFYINPVDAEKYGIEDGDWVWIESKRNKIRGKALVTLMVSPGVTFMERFWFPETLGTETQGYKEMSVNMLTNDAGPFNDVIGSCTYRGFCIKVSKADEGPAGVWTEPEQFEAWLPDMSDTERTSYPTMEEVTRG